jgi:AmmeMemoRadiSam system protein A
MTALDVDDGRTLLDVAVGAIAAELFGSDEVDLAGLPQALRAPGASFVTLERSDSLLGCIGTIEPVRPLADDVAVNARQSAFADPRMPAVNPGDFEVMSLKISVLSALDEMPARSFDEVVGWLRPGVDGVLLDAGGRRATFLPSVWEKLPDGRSFLRQLLLKAGLDGRGWPRHTRGWRYTTDELIDPGPRTAPAATSAAHR